MRLTHDVDVPAKLISAQQEGRLVIFAGAGVSMGPPSNLPNFLTLAEQVAHPPLDRPQDDEALDRYLGRAEERGVDVQRRTRELIDLPSSSPTPLHEHLVELFGATAPLRIVTTNFDRHFTTCVTAKFGADADIYYAPALPRGGDFAGLVYLHGAVERPRTRLVLTDRDFGRAYITEGWAARMLTDMFTAYTVLFVGYSHSDPIVSYLARGLVPGTARYALTEDPSRGWDLLGITPVLTPLRADPDRYGALRDVLAAWAGASQQGVLDHEARLRTLLRIAPPIDPTDHDYLRAALADPVKLRFFTRYAATPDWLEFAEEHDGLRPLFEPDAADPTRAEVLSRWVAEKYALNHAGPALSVVTRGGPNRLHPEFSLALAREIASRDPRPDAGVVLRWTTLFAGAVSDRRTALALEIVLRKCTRHEDRGTALLIFGRLTRPVLVPEAAGWVGDANDSTKLPYGVSFPGQIHSIEHAWTEILRPGLPANLVELALTVSENLAHAHHLLTGAGVAKEGWDPVSFRRQAIEPHEQDRFPKPLDVLVNVARDLVEAAWREDVSIAESLIRLWAGTRAPLLRRLALHGRAVDPNLAGDETIDWVIGNRWLFDPALKHEVFRVLAIAYPRATPEGRERLLTAVRDTEVRALDGTQLPSDLVRRARFDLAEWIRRHMDQAAELDALIDTLRAEQPGMAAREHPDLSYWIGRVEWVTPVSPVSAEALVREPTHTWSEGRLMAMWEEADEDGRVGLEQTLRSVPAEHLDWTIELARGLAASAPGTGWAWRALAEGWKHARPCQDQWVEIVDILRADPVLQAEGRAVADLLQHGLESGGIPFERIEIVEGIADRLLDLHADAPFIASPAAHDEWLFVAINHVGGEAAQVWLQALARRARENEADALTEAHRARVVSVAAAATRGRQTARVVLASQIGYFFTLDPVWASETLLPWFDWNTDALRAEQSWHGFAGGGAWIDPLIVQMLPFLEQSFGRLEQELAPVAHSLIVRIAAVALQGSVDPIESGWLDRFYLASPESARLEWIRELKQQLGGMSPDAIRVAWDRWLRQYWSRRLDGTPVPFSNAERDEIPELTLALDAVFSEAVSLAVRTPASLAEHSMVFVELRQSPLLNSHPDDVAALATHILRGVARVPYDAVYVAEIAEHLCSSGITRERLIGLLAAMAQHGILATGDCVERSRREAS